MTEVVALTGATGFVGRHVATALLGSGRQVRALARRPDAELAAAGVRLVPGSLADAAALAELVQGADAVVHVAGAIQAPDRAAFLAANATGSAMVAAAAAQQPGRQLIHVSSLAAREPSLSFYAETKALGEAEALQRADRLQVAVVRPPAVYGPGDRATLPIIQGLDRGWLPVPRSAAARFSLLEVADLAALVLNLLDAPPPSGTVLEPDDGRTGGYGWADLAAIAEARLKRRVRLVRLPRAPLAAAAGWSERYAAARGRMPLLSRGKVAELFHHDWVCDRRSLEAVPGWQPQVGFAQGLVATLAWYREAGWL